MGAWGQSQDEYAGARVAKTRHRPRPVFMIEVGAPLFLAYPLAVFNQPRTTNACDHFPVKDGQRAEHRRHCIGTLFPGGPVLKRRSLSCALHACLLSFPTVPLSTTAGNLLFDIFRVVRLNIGLREQLVESTYPGFFLGQFQAQSVKLVVFLRKILKEARKRIAVGPAIEHHERSLLIRVLQ